MTVARPMTYEEERGKPPPSLNHGIVEANLMVELSRYPAFRVACEVTLDLGETEATPDLSVFPRQPIDLLRDQLRCSTVPIMVVEILTATQGSFEVLQRFRRYFEAGVKSCWLVHPPLRTILILQPDWSETRIHEGIAVDPATGITVEWARVFS